MLFTYILIAGIFLGFLMLAAYSLNKRAGGNTYMDTTLQGGEGAMTRDFPKDSSYPDDNMNMPITVTSTNLGDVLYETLEIDLDEHAVTLPTTGIKMVAYENDATEVEEVVNSYYNELGSQAEAPLVIVLLPSSVFEYTLTGGRVYSQDNAKTFIPFVFLLPLYGEDKGFVQNEKNVDLLDAPMRTYLQEDAASPNEEGNMRYRDSGSRSTRYYALESLDQRVETSSGWQKLSTVLETLPSNLKAALNPSSFQNVRATGPVYVLLPVELADVVNAEEGFANARFPEMYQVDAAVENAIVKQLSNIDT
jgi:hypothetical protein